MSIFPTRLSLPQRSTPLSRVLLHTAVAAFALMAGRAETSPEAVVHLTWRNGDELSGQLLAGGGEGMLRFDARPFTTPLDLRLGQLGGIRFPSAIHRREPPSEPHFEISLRNGDQLQGKLIRLDREGITLDCSPHLGVVEIPRPSMARLTASSGGNLSFSRIGGLEEWSSTGRDRGPSDWFTGLRGELTTHKWSGNLYREIAFPEKVEVHFRAAFPGGRPNFDVGLLRDPEEGPMLETWDGTLVLTYRSRFVPVMEMSEETKELDLRLFWNQATGEVRLCAPSGR